LEAGAVGIFHEQYGEDIAVCVILKSGACCVEQGLDCCSDFSSCPMEKSEKTCSVSLEIYKFCEKKLGEYKSPIFIRSVKDLPRGPSGKLQRRKLKRFFQKPEENISGAIT